VDWTVEGTHALCGWYRSKADIVAATFDRLHGVLVGGATLEVRHLYVDGDTTVAGLRSTSKTNEGATFANNYCYGWRKPRNDGDCGI
jgi:ketosteroid isomerase-like protein